FESLSITFKRVMNILKDFAGGAVRPSRLKEEAEKTLYERYLEVEQEVKACLEQKDYETALAALLTLKSPVDRFFDNILVMAEDPELRNNRLALLWHIARLFLRVGDLSAISVPGR
ncbi:MAG TPA: glycine--tRNA ligase subunit beta, partial [Thermodesulfobacteriaceae bacterium]|nr:glycine--tRNA ligase subunit beta [Thermodesulfobacteriaceae bacterium]